MSQLTRPPNQWTEHFARLAAQASAGGALSHELYVSRYSTSVAAALDGFPPERKKQLLLSAGYWNYATSKVREQARVWNANNGYCIQGLPYACCPTGCGEE